MNIKDKNRCARCFEPIPENEQSCRFCGYTEQNNAEPDTSLPLGTILLGRFLIGRTLGRGGFGITYLAYDLSKDCKVAIKEYLPDTVSYRTPGSTLVSSYRGEREENFKLGSEKFYDEAKTLARFNGHPNVINVYEFFYENNTAYFVMEYVDGMDLKSYVSQNGGKLEAEDLLRIITPVLDALIVVHSVGILHRDISPDNIYITKDGNVKLLDFGAARQVLGEQSKSLSVVLKPGFAPVEQYQSRSNQGPWTDIYALAATMFYCMVGSVPEAALDRIDQDNLRSISAFGITIAPSLDRAIIKALSVRASNRFQSVSEFKQALLFQSTTHQPSLQQAAVQQSVINGTPARHFGRRSGRKKLIVVIAVVFSIILYAGIGTLVYKIATKGDTEVDNQNISAASASVMLDESAASTATHTTVTNVDYIFANDYFQVKTKYSGGWGNNQPNGFGEMTMVETIGPWVEGDKLNGIFENGNLNGEGKCSFASGASYAGMYENGLMNGKGKHITKDGDVYEGEFVNNQYSGTGTYTSHDGSKYSGQLKDSYFDGQGTYTWTNGDTYTGEWINGQREGNGTYIWASGEKYVGQFKNNKKDGQGIYYDANGEILQQGTWVNGEFTEK